MTKPIIKIVNLETGEEIEREMTDEEFDLWKADMEETEQRKVEAEIKAVAKSVLLERLGITEEEAKLLLG